MVTGVGGFIWLQKALVIHCHATYFRDKKETLKTLSDEERKEIAGKDNVKFSKVGARYESPKKERGLKIYLDSSPPPKQSDPDD